MNNYSNVNDSNNHYESGNYNRNKEYCDYAIKQALNNLDEWNMEMKALEFKLNLLLTRFRDRNDMKPDWNNQNQCKWLILYDYNYETFKVVMPSRCLRNTAVVHFVIKGVAEQALQKFEKEFAQLKKYYQKFA